MIRLRTLVRPALAAALAAPLLGLSGAAAQPEPADTPILPGFWKYSVKAVALVPVEGGRRCITEAEIDKFIAFPGNKHYKCNYPTKTIAGGKVSMAGACVDKRGRQAPIRANGTYTPESFKLNIWLRTINGIPVSGTMNAQRISASCPAAST